MRGILAVFLIALALLSALPVSAQVVISEFMASNSKASGFELRDEDDKASDWIELYNSGSMSVDMAGWYLTDQPSFLPKWRFPSNVLTPGSNQVVFASGKNRTNSWPLHTNFELPGNSGYLALVAPDGTTVVQEFANYPQQRRSITFGLPFGATPVPNLLSQSPGTTNPGLLRSITVTEIMYHPAAPETGSAFLAEDFQFIELSTQSSANESRHLTVTGDIEFSGPITIEPNRPAVLVANPDAFRSRYGLSVSVAGEFRGHLSRSSGSISLVQLDSRGHVDGAVYVTYDDRWHPATDGHGFSLVNRDPVSPQAYAPGGWRPSTASGGSPGAPDPAPTTPGGVVINEVLAHSAAPFEDTIELLNLTTNDVDISGWYLSDRSEAPKKFQFPRGSIVLAGEFIALDEHSFNVSDDAGNGRFELRASGEEVYLFSASPEGELTGYAHGFEFGAAAANVSLGRYTLSTGEEDLVPQVAMSVFETNQGPRVGPIVISEIMFDPPSAYRGINVENLEDEYVELHNLTDEPILLGGAPDGSGVRWGLRDGVDFAFPLEAILPARGYVVVVGFNPANAAVLAGFRAGYRIPSEVPIHGPSTGKLSNNGDTLELVEMRSDPEDPEPFTHTVDRVRYSTSRPWPLLAAGAGASLQRADPFAYGDDPANWQALRPSPGLPAPTGIGMRINAATPDLTVDGGTTVNLFVDAEPKGALGYQWFHEKTPLYQATGPNLLLPNAQPGHQGRYTCFVMAPGGAVAVPITLGVTNFSPSFALPEVTLTHPLGTMLQTRAGRITLTGTAEGPDVAAVVIVARNVDGKVDRLARGTTNWVADIPLVAGTNQIEVQAFTSFFAGGIRRELAIEYLVDFPVRISAAGPGTIVGPTNGQLLAIGQKYRLVAKPAPGHILRDWSEPGDQVFSDERILTFSMVSNLNLTATFIPDPFPALAGTYRGLVLSEDLNIAGPLTLHVGPGGRFAGSYRSAMGRERFKGKLNGRLEGNFSTVSPTDVGWPDTAPELMMSLVLTTNGLAEVAMVTPYLEGSVPVFRQPPRRLREFRPEPGRFLLELDDSFSGASPAGSGLLRISAAGFAEFAGRLDDGLRFARSLPVLSNGRMPYYSRRTAAPHITAGWILAALDGDTPISGTLSVMTERASGGIRTITIRGTRAPVENAR